MTDLTKEQEAALVEALEDGGKFSDAGSAACITMGTFTAVQSGKLWLTRGGAALAQALKERDEARNERDVTHRALIELVTQGVISDSRARELLGMKAREWRAITLRILGDDE